MIADLQTQQNHKFIFSFIAISPVKLGNCKKLTAISNFFLKLLEMIFQVRISHYSPLVHFLGRGKGIEPFSQVVPLEISITIKFMQRFSNKTCYNAGFFTLFSYLYNFDLHPLST